MKEANGRDQASTCAKMSLGSDQRHPCAHLQVVLKNTVSDTLDTVPTPSKETPIPPAHAVPSAGLTLAARKVRHNTHLHPPLHPAVGRRTPRAALRRPSAAHQRPALWAPSSTSCEEAVVRGRWRPPTPSATFCRSAWALPQWQACRLCMLTGRPD